MFWLSEGLDRRTPWEHLLIGMAEALCVRGHQIHILQKNTEGPKPILPPRLQELGVTTTVIQCNQPAKSNFAARYLTDVVYILKCKRWIRRNRAFDRVVLQSSNVAWLLGLVLRKFLPNVLVTFNVQDIFPENAAYSRSISHNGVFYKVLSFLQRCAYNYVDKIITISEDMKQQLTELGVSAEKIEVIYNWSYQDEPYRQEQLDIAAARELLPEGFFHVVYAGNIGKMQNVDIVVDAAQRLSDHSDIRFTIIGEGLYKEKLETLAQRAGLENLVFLPMQDSSLAPSIYATADLNVIPLAENIYKTALPSKTATCLACGKPVIFCFGARSRFVEMVEQVSGCDSVSAEDTDQLCRLILKYQANAPTGDLTKVFVKHMQRSANSEGYARHILGE